MRAFIILLACLCIIGSGCAQSAHTAGNGLSGTTSSQTSSASAGGPLSSLFSILNPSPRQEIVVLIDGTDTCRSLRGDPEVKRFLKVLFSRPEYDLRVFQMAPDRIAPCSIDVALSENFTVDSSNRYSGGNLQQAISWLEERGYERIVLISDGENNRRTEEGIVHLYPEFSVPERFILIGVSPDFYQTYVNMGITCVALSDLPKLSRYLVMGEGFSNNSSNQGAKK